MKFQVLLVAFGFDQSLIFGTVFRRGESVTELYSMLSGSFIDIYRLSLAGPAWCRTFIDSPIDPFTLPALQLGGRCSLDTALCTVVHCGRVECTMVHCCGVWWSGVDTVAVAGQGTAGTCPSPPQVGATIGGQCWCYAILVLVTGLIH